VELFLLVFLQFSFPLTSKVSNIVVSKSLFSETSFPGEGMVGEAGSFEKRNHLPQKVLN